MSEQATSNSTSWLGIAENLNLLGVEIAPLTIILTISIVVAGFLIAHFARLVTAKYIGTKLPHTTRRSMGRLVYYGIIAIALLSALGVSGLDLSGLFLAGGIVGIVIGFATQSLFSNLISGIFLQIDKPMRAGDPVLITGKLPDVSGTVVEIRTLSSRFLMFDGTYVRLPNSDVFLSEIRNYSSAVARRVEFSCGVSYNADLKRVVRVIRESLWNTPLVLVEPEPDIYVEVLDESAVMVNVWCWAPFNVWFDMKKQLVQQVKIALDANGIEIPLPQRVVHVASGSKRRTVSKSQATTESSLKRKLELDEFSDQGDS